MGLRRPVLSRGPGRASRKAEPVAGSSALALHLRCVYAQSMQKPAQMVRAAREAAHMSASELAQRAGVSVSTVTRLEQGKLDPTVGMLTRLLSAADAEFRIDLELNLDRPELARLVSAWHSNAEGDQLDWTAIRGLLDRLRQQPELIAGAIARRPRPSGSPLLDALLAGLAEKLADDAGLPRPDWTQRGRKLRRRWAPAGTPRQTAYRRERTPEQRARRNLVVDAQTLWREPGGA